MSFVERRLNVSFHLGEGSFGESGANSVKIRDARVSARISKAGGMSMCASQIEIYGLPQSRMNELSTYGLKWSSQRRNEVSVEAGDSDGNMSTVFVGTISDAWADYGAMPDVPLRVVAQSGLFDTVKPTPATSYEGGVDVATIMAGLASKMGLSFENSGVNVRLSNPYFSGSARQQVIACASAANIEHIIDNSVLAIWNPGSARGSQVPIIAPRTGLIGYPSFTSKGILWQGIYDPSIGYGSKISMESSVKPACGEWIIYKLDYNLDSMVPKGQWSYTAEATRPGQGVVR